jgi:hypothetical protein
MSFDKRWEKKDDLSNLDKLMETIKPSDPLRAKLESSTRRVETQTIASRSCSTNRSVKPSKKIIQHIKAGG